MCVCECLCFPYLSLCVCFSSLAAISAPHSPTRDGKGDEPSPPAVTWSPDKDSSLIDQKSCCVLPWTCPRCVCDSSTSLVQIASTGTGGFTTTCAPGRIGPHPARRQSPLASCLLFPTGPPRPSRPRTGRPVLNPNHLRTRKQVRSAPAEKAIFAGKLGGGDCEVPW